MPGSTSIADSTAAASKAAASPGAGSADQCPANIGPAERRKRLLAGIAGLAIATLATLLMISDGAPRSWRLLLVLPWWTACLGLFQARARVCVALASKGLRSLSGQQEPQPAQELEAVRREARRVHLRAALAAIALTLLSSAWP